MGVVPRQSVAIMLPTSADYFSTCFGILMAGAIPVPIDPPARDSQPEDHVLRHTGIVSDAGAVTLITMAEAMVVARLLQARVPGLRHVVTPQQLASGGGTPTQVTVRGDDIAFIQYTSGSTGNPKGVALTHANLLANIRAMAGAIDATPSDVFVSWLPLHHDMGLIGAWLAPLYVGFPLVVMSPLAFLSKPLRWLQAMHRWRGTLSAGPNFAYELCRPVAAGRIFTMAPPKVSPQQWAPTGKRHTGRLRRSARLETVRGHNFGSVVGRPSAGSPILRSGRRMAPRCTTNVTARSRPCCTAWCSSTPPPSSTRLSPRLAPICRSL